MAALTAPRQIFLDLPALHAGQQRIRDSKARFKVAAIGRRWGKTHFGVDEAIEVMLDGGNVGWFAPTYKLLAGEGGVWPYAMRLLQPVIARISVQEHTVKLLTGGIGEFWSLENGGADKARGREYDRIIADETAMVPDFRDQWDNALRPMLTTRQGKALFLSTPRGFNDFYTLYKRGSDAEYDDWAAFHAPSNDSPFFPAEEWQALLDAVSRGELSASTFAQEYEAIFTAPEGLVYGLDRDGIAFYEPGRNIRAAPVAWEKCKWRIAAIDPGGDQPNAYVAVGVTEDDRHHVYYAERFVGGADVLAFNEWLSDLNKAGPLDAVVLGEVGGDTMVNTLRRMGWRAFGFNKDRGHGISHVRALLKSGRLTIGPAFRSAFDEEIYVYLFPPMEAGRQRTPWTTTVESSAHHADLLDALRYACVGVLDGYPGAVQSGGVRRAVPGRGGVRRAG